MTEPLRHDQSGLRLGPDVTATQVSDQAQSARPYPISASDWMLTFSLFRRRIYQQSVRVPARSGPDREQTQVVSSATLSHVLTPDMLVADTRTGPDISWSISSPHTMTSGCTAPSPPAHCYSEPEIDVIDGQSFMSFETLDAILSYTRANELPLCGDVSRVKRFRSSSETTAAVTVQPSSSAFVSTTLDEYLKKTRDELRRFPAAGHSASPPHDSRIYETGVLKMDCVRKPFADLPKLPQVRDSAAAPPPLSHGVENNPAVQKAAPEAATCLKRKKTTLQEFDAEKVDAEQMEKTVARLVHDAAKEIFLSRKSRHISFPMDETYCNFALEALTITPAEPAEQESPEKRGKKSHKRAKCRDEAMHLHNKSAKDTDLVAMISRNRDGAKRDIRLPSRYQESALIEGNQWICAAPFGTETVPDKRSRKRLLEEQKRLQVLKHPVTDSPETGRKSPDKQTLAVKRKVSQPSKSMPMVKLPSPTKRPVDGLVRTADTVAPAVTVGPVAAVRTVPALGMKPAASGKGQDLKQLYRELYFECCPERRAYYQKKCVKPRVHKQQTVEEAIRLIHRLQIREKQLLYIKKLNSLWHRKLDLCSQVITNKVRPEPNPAKDTATVVTSVLQAYQNSVCYRISAALEKQQAQSKPIALRPQPSPAGPAPIPAALPQTATGTDDCPHSVGSEDSDLRDEKRTVVSSGINHSSKADSSKRSKKIRQQSLLLPQKIRIVPAVPNSLTNGATPTPSLPLQLMPGDRGGGRVNIVDVNQEARDVIIDGKPCKKFVWGNNKQMLPDQLLSNVRAEASSSTIMSSE